MPPRPSASLNVAAVSSSDAAAGGGGGVPRSSATTAAAAVAEAGGGGGGVDDDARPDDVKSDAPTLLLTTTSVVGASPPFPAPLPLTELVRAASINGGCGGSRGTSSAATAALTPTGADAAALPHALPGAAAAAEYGLSSLSAAGALVAVTIVSPPASGALTNRSNSSRSTPSRAGGGGDSPVVRGEDDAHAAAAAAALTSASPPGIVALELAAPPTAAVRRPSTATALANGDDHAGRSGGGVVSVVSLSIVPVPAAAAATTTAPMMMAPGSAGAAAAAAAAVVDTKQQPPPPPPNNAGNAHHHHQQHWLSLWPRVDTQCSVLVLSFLTLDEWGRHVVVVSRSWHRVVTSPGSYLWTRVFSRPLTDLVGDRLFALLHNKPTRLRECVRTELLKLSMGQQRERTAAANPNGANAVTTLELPNPLSVPHSLAFVRRSIANDEKWPVPQGSYKAFVAFRSAVQAFFDPELRDAGARQRWTIVVEQHKRVAERVQLVTVHGFGAVVWIGFGVSVLSLCAYLAAVFAASRDEHVPDHWWRALSACWAALCWLLALYTVCVSGVQNWLVPEYVDFRMRQAFSGRTDHARHTAVRRLYVTQALVFVVACAFGITFTSWSNGSCSDDDGESSSSSGWRWLCTAPPIVGITCLLCGVCALIYRPGGHDWVPNPNNWLAGPPPPHAFYSPRDYFSPVWGCPTTVPTDIIPPQLLCWSLLLWSWLVLVALKVDGRVFPAGASSWALVWLPVWLLHVLAIAHVRAWARRLSIDFSHHYLPLLWVCGMTLPQVAFQVLLVLWLDQRDRDDGDSDLTLLQFAAIPLVIGFVSAPVAVCWLRRRLRYMTAADV